jgi:hypothetical protein
MRFMLLMYPDTRAEAGVLPDVQTVGETMKYNEALAKAGVLLALDGLHPTSKGARITFPAGRPKVTDGPFGESNEIVGGYWLIQVKSREEAIEWAKRYPGTNTRFIEVRQVLEVTDFPADVREAADNRAVRASLERARGL